MSPAPPAPRQLAAAVLAQLRRVDRLACDRARALATDRPTEGADLRGLFISDADFHALTSETIDRPALVVQDGDASDGTVPSDAWLAVLDAFGLSRLEGDVVLLALLLEVDLRYERIYAYLNDDVSARRLTVDLSLSLLCPDLVSRLRQRECFGPDGSLVRHGLITLHEREGTDTLLACSIQLDGDVARRLLWSQDQPPGLPGGITRVCGATEGSFDPDEELRAAIARCSSLPGGPRRRIHIRTDDDWAARQTAALLAAAWDAPLLLADFATVTREPHLWTRLATVAQREARCEGAALAVRVPVAAEPERGIALSQIAEVLAAFPGPVLWLSADELDLVPGDEPVAHLRIRPLSYPHRLALWDRTLGTRSGRAQGAIEAVAGRFRLSGDQIHRAARLAHDAAWQREPERVEVTFDDMAASSRAVSAGALGELARRIEPVRTWDDLVLPADRIAQLREMCDQFIYRPLVLDTWGLGKSSLGRGLSALFAGASGTGKTMAAEVIARELGLDLYKIDLSGVVSKYIGETEKNLERIFDMARDSNAILLFDEADALFGKRSETKDAHDRYANIEISYLLQKIEEYDGVVILTSNLRQNLDEAFLRRLQFSVEFPMPDEESRLDIWRRSLPARTPLRTDVDLSALSRRFKFAGGSIRNVCVNAAFLAARDGQIVGMEQMLWAARREFQKLGKLVDEAQFAREQGRPRRPSEAP